MTADAQWAVQQAVYAALTGDAALQALLGNPPRVFDQVPQDAPFPYLVLGLATARGSDTKTEDGMEQTLALHTWSRQRGLSETKQIMAAIVDALDRAALSVSGHSLVDLRFEFSETLLDPDGLTRHGVQRFRVVTERAA